jgi:hypothetical protein
MGTIRVRVQAEETEAARPAEGVRGEVKEIRRDRKGVSELIPMGTDELAASLKGLTGELGRLFGDIRRVGAFELHEVQVGLEISAEGGFNLIGSAKAGGTGAITLTFAPGKAKAG